MMPDVLTMKRTDERLVPVLEFQIDVIAAHSVPRLVKPHWRRGTQNQWAHKMCAKTAISAHANGWNLCGVPRGIISARRLAVRNKIMLKPATKPLTSQET